MINVKRKKILCIFVILFVVIPSFNFAFADNFQMESGLKPELQDLSSAQSNYSAAANSMTMGQEGCTATPGTSEPAATGTSDFECTPTPTIPTTINSTPTPAPELIYNETSDFGNDFDSAYTVVDNTSISGKVNISDPIDMFCYSTSTDADILVSTNYTKGYAIGSIFDCYGNIIKDQNDTDIGSLPALITFHAYKNTKYYIKIAATDFVESGSYTLKINQFIDDYSDNPVTANDIFLGQEISGNIVNNTDVDCFKFTPSKDGIYRIYSKNYNYSNKIFDENGSQIAINNNYIKLNANTTYYFNISKDSNYSYSYFYSFQIKGPIEESAHEIQLDTKIQGLAGSSTDIDFFSFSPSVAGLYNIDCFADINYIPYNLKILDSNNKLVSLYYKSNLTTYFSLAKDTVYYFSFEKLDFNTPLNYSFILKGPTPDDFGNTPESATEIKLDDTVKGIIESDKDNDYFFFKPSTSGNYRINNFSTQFNDGGLLGITNTPNIKDIVSIADPYGNQIKTYYTYSQAYFTLVKDITYFICLSNIKTGLIFEYSFVMEPIEDDYGDTKETAHEIKLNEEVKGSIDYFGDTDYFRYRPTVSGIYNMDNLSSSSSPFPNLRDSISIMDSYGNIIVSNGSPAYFSLTKDTEYFIYIENENYPAFDYSFTLTKLPDDCGDTPSYSRPIGLGETVNAKIDYPYDQDLFSFKTNAKGLYYISISGMNFDSITLYNESNSEVIPNRINYLMANQTYYIMIKSYNITKYSLCVNGPIADESSSPIVKMGNNSAAINYPGDIDEFKFIPSVSGTYFFKLDSKMNMNVKIKDTNYSGNQYYEINEKTNSCYLTANDIYKISVSASDSSSTGDYSLIISDNLEAITNNTFKITGYIKPDFTDSLLNSMRAGFKISVSGTDLTAISDENGYFEIAVPKSAAGYDIIITKDGYLDREIKGIPVNDNVSLSKFEAPIELWVGDFGEYHDGTINLMDITQIAKCFNSAKGSPRYSESMDINNDSVINIEDVMIVVKHFNKSKQNYQ